MTRRRLLLPPAIVVAVLSLAACEIPLPSPTVTPTVDNPGAVVSDQSSAIISDTMRRFAIADAASDASLLAPRVAGDAAAVRKAEYVVAAAGGDKPDAIPSTTLAVYGPAGKDWPRSLVAITDAPDETLTPVVLWWTQDDARSPYVLREWAHMLPGAIVPAMPNQSVGDTQIPLDAEGLSMTPQAAIDAYVSLLKGASPRRRRSPPTRIASGCSPPGRR